MEVHGVSSAYTARYHGMPRGAVDGIPWGMEEFRGSFMELTKCKSLIGRESRRNCGCSVVVDEV